MKQHARRARYKSQVIGLKLGADALRRIELLYSSGRYRNKSEVVEKALELFASPIESGQDSDQLLEPLSPEMLDRISKPMKYIYPEIAEAGRKAGEALERAGKTHLITDALQPI